MEEAGFEWFLRVVGYIVNEVASINLSKVLSEFAEWTPRAELIISDTLSHPSSMWLSRFAQPSVKTDKSFSLENTLEASASQRFIGVMLWSSKYGSSENEIHGNVFKCHVYSFIYFSFHFVSF